MNYDDGVESINLSLPGLQLIRLNVLEDARGSFRECYQQDRYADHGIACDFVQDNFSISKKDVIRGMHFQSGPGQAKLVTAVQGKIFDVAVDIRPGSKTFGKWEGVYLEKGLQLFIPVGFAHGFCVVSEEAHVLYKVSTLYHPETEKTFCFDDPHVNIAWPTAQPVLSQRDQNAPYLQEIFG